MSKRLEKSQPQKLSEVIELDDALLDLAVGGLDSDLFKDLESTNMDYPRSPPANSVAHCGASRANG